MNEAIARHKQAALSQPMPEAAAQDHGEMHGLDTAERVCFYEQDFYVLSNFSSFNLRWKGNTFPTSEHAYHWEKFDSHPNAWNAGGSIASQILRAPSAHEAFKIAEGCKPRRRPDWDDVKVDIMRDILRAKAAQHEYVRRKLLATGERELVENSWRDSYWGWGPNRDGQNMLGKLWMEVRAELRAASPAAPEGAKKSDINAEYVRGRNDGWDAAMLAARSPHPQPQAQGERSVCPLGMVDTCCQDFKNCKSKE